MHGTVEKGVAQVAEALAATAAAKRGAHSHTVAQAAQALRQPICLQRLPGRAGLLPRQRHLAHQLGARTTAI